MIVAPVRFCNAEKYRGFLIAGFLFIEIRLAPGVPGCLHG